MLFPFRHQPLKAFFIAGSVFYLICAIPVWTVTNALPSWRPRRSWPLKRTLIIKLLRTAAKILYQIGVDGSPPLDSFKRERNRIVWVEPAAPDLIVGEIRDLAEMNGVKPVKVAGYWGGPIGSDGVPGQRASPEERVIYHFHGGAHIRGTSHPDGVGTDGCIDGYLTFGPNIRVFSLEYRLASAAPYPPANPFPSTLLDALAGYRYLVEDVGFDPSRIILTGDSAGGGIVFNLARYLAIANLPSLKQAGGLLLLSPTMDWGQTYADDPSSAFVRNASCDFVQAIVEHPYTPRALLGKLPDEYAKKSLWISPGARSAEWQPGAFAGLPPTFIQAGSAEQTLDGMLAVRDRLLKDLGPERVTYYEVPDAVHTVVSSKWYEPERTEVIKKMAEWVRGL